MQEQQTTPVIELPPMGDMNPQQTAQKSQTHWVWTAYKDINNMGPMGIYSQLGYRDQRWTELKRCVPYPLGNLESSEPDREAAAASSGYGLNAETLSKIVYVKNAQAQAAELGEMYGDAGLKILLPLLGMNDRERVNQIVQAVQPFEYEIHEMAHEFTEGAKKRIEASNLSDEDKGKAYELAGIFQRGAKDAETKALAEYEALISSMSDKMAGGPGISNPNPFHHWICKQLDKPVPERIDRTGGKNTDSKAINILAERALREESAAESMAEQLAQEREERAKLEAKVDQLLAAQEQGQKTSAKQPRV